MDAAVALPAATMPKALVSLGVEHEADALRVVPTGFYDFTTVRIGFDSLRVGDSIIVAARMVTRVQIAGAPRDGIMAEFEVTDSVSAMKVQCYGVHAELVASIKPEIGELVHLAGEIRERYGSDELFLYKARLVPASRAGRVEPIYPLDSYRTAPLVERLARDPKMRVEAAARILSHFPGETSTSVLKRCGVHNNIGLEDWLLALHCPANMVEANAALAVARRLAALEVCFQATALHTRQPVEGSALKLRPEQVANLIAQLPFKLTEDQEQAIVDCCEEVITNVPARRLISGDVGTGKTAVFATVAAAAYLAGAKVVILVPNLLVVDQHLAKMKEWWPNIPAMRVIGTTNLKQADLAARPILVGTTALITRLVKHGYVPDLLVVDEQHKLSKEQREFVLGPHTHYIEATATCIPRTMAVVAHGGMDLSVLRQCPYQKSVQSRVYDARHRKELFQRVTQAVADGGQVAVIYPRIESRDEQGQDKHSFEDALKAWQKQFPGKVEGLHGKMKAEEKTAVIDAMRRRQFDILVTTTVVEVGIDLPDLRAAVVVEADRFGLNQLHQIRGRVARHGGRGDFYLYLPSPVDHETMQRLRVLEKVADGFALADEDLRLRGFGDLVEGTRQSGRAAIHCLLGAELDYSTLRSVLSENQ